MPTDPFELTPRESSTSSSLSSASPPRSPSHVLTVGAFAMQGAALWVIHDAWKSGLIPVSWHALLSIVLVMLPSDSLTELGKGVVRAWGRRK
jgi:hypothetical protein